MDIVKDYEGQVPRSPQTPGRTILRTALVILLTTFLLTILVLFFTIGAPSTRTTRHDRETAVYELKQQESDFGKKDAWSCPCQSEVSYSDFMTMNLTRSPDDPGRLLQVDDNSYYFNTTTNDNPLRYDICQGLTSNTCQRYRNNTLHFQSDMACDVMLFSTMTKRGTVIPFNYVSKAHLVWQAAASQAQVALLPAISYRQEWYTEAYQNEWLCLEDLLTVLSFTWHLVAISDILMPDAAAFWSQSQARTSGHLPYGAVWSFAPYNNNSDGALQTLQNISGSTEKHLIDAQYQPVMPVLHFNWSAFIDACDVPYCDVTRRSPVWYRAFTAFSQIGGFTTVAVVTVRVVLWPLCTWLLLSRSIPKAASSAATSSQLATVNSGQTTLFAGPYSNFAVSRTDP